MLLFYNQIINASDKDDLNDIDVEVKTSVLNGTLTDDRDIMILNLAIRLRHTEFTIEDIEAEGRTTIIVMGGADDVDIEELQLNQLMKDELDELEEGNVVSMKNFKKKED